MRLCTKNQPPQQVPQRVLKPKQSEKDQPEKDQPEKDQPEKDQPEEEQQTEERQEGERQEGERQEDKIAPGDSANGSRRQEGEESLLCSCEC